MNSAPVGELLAATARQLATVSATARLDAEILLAAALDRPRSFLWAWPQHCPEPQQSARFQAWLQRRVAGEPVAYLLGQREFWSLPLMVSPDTLIPRPETELLVELALHHLPMDQAVTVADLGVGSGAIALALAKERPLARIIATDCSGAALTVALYNAQHLGIANVEFREGDWCQPLGEETFDLIVSNPPYVATDDPGWAQGQWRFEPQMALAAGTDGLAALRILIEQTPNHLKPGSWLLLEHGCDQGESVPILLRESGFTMIADHRDAAGLSRASSGHWPG